MLLNDTDISRRIIEGYTEKLLATLNLDVALVGAGPANLVAGFYLGKAGVKAAIFESKLAPGGGMWGGGMMFNEIVIQEDALSLVEELGIRYQDKTGGYFTMDSVEATSTIISQCLRAGTKIFNLIRATDVLFRGDNGGIRVCGLVINWSPVENLGLHVDPLGIEAKFVVDGTGHPAEICHIVTRKMDVKLHTKTGEVVGEMPLWAEKGEQFTVENTREVFPGLYVVGMAANNAFGGPRMGPIFGGMLLSGRKAAEELIGRIKG
ncbi:MAG: thiazole biosynthesis protein [Deltaproteobacteria bacterium]|nr:thiazole biosynthesis protein [Deltaproteobacteria bacterium]MBW1928388.1 thiazole biosynthesis protein [Deltaproteobacteria bacterium]MBW2023813.1 thiazole biosynthesis protein [Deltaproteobacteria bacterium]MBW2124574.1 thiazole biosynthesis protein [Deltaproteobacteria bacterium]